MVSLSIGHNVWIKRKFVYLLLLVSSFIASSASSQFSTKTDVVERSKRGVILDAIGNIIHPKKEGGSQVSDQKKLSLNTPLGSFSISAIHQQYQKPIVPANSGDVDQSHQGPQPITPQINNAGSSNYYPQQYPSSVPNQHNYQSPNSYLTQQTLPSAYFYVNPHHNQYPLQYDLNPQHNPQQQQPAVNENKEKDETDIVWPTHKNDPSQDGKLNEGGIINVVKKETDKHNPSNNEQNLLESVFGPLPSAPDVSGTGKINIRVGGH